MPTLKAFNSIAQGCRASGYPGKLTDRDSADPERVALEAPCATLSGSWL